MSFAVRIRDGTVQRQLRVYPESEPHHQEIAPMSKGMNQKREQKRKPEKTLDEKRAAKKAKKAERASARTI